MQKGNQLPMSPKRAREGWRERERGETERGRREGELEQPSLSLLVVKHV